MCVSKGGWYQRCHSWGLYIPLARKLGTEDQRCQTLPKQTFWSAETHLNAHTHTLTHRGGSHQLALRRTLACELARGRWQCSHVLPLKGPDHNTQNSATLSHIQVPAHPRGPRPMVRHLKVQCTNDNDFFPALHTFITNFDQQYAQFWQTDPTRPTQLAQR